MSHANDQIVIPRPAIMAAAGLIGLSLLLAITARLTDIGATRLTLPAPVETLRLTFADRTDGGIVVTDTARSRAIREYAPGDGGFIRVVLRTMAQKRAAAGIGDSAPFELSRDAAGRAVLVDPQTGGLVTLSAFGPGNAAAFAELLDKGRETQ